MTGALSRRALVAGVGGAGLGLSTDQKAAARENFGTISSLRNLADFADVAEARRNIRLVRALADFRLGPDADDTGAMTRGIAWALAGTDDRALALPEAVALSIGVSGAITGTKRLSILAERGHCRIAVKDGVSPFAFMRDYAAGIVMIGCFELVRTVTPGTTMPEAGVGLLINRNVASSTECGIPGPVVIQHLDCKADTTGFAWFGGAKIVSPVNMRIDFFRNIGRNATYLVEEPSASGYDPAAYSYGLWLHGASTTAYLIDNHIQTLICVGAHVGLRLTRAVQGVYIHSWTLVGNNYGLHAYALPADVAELVSLNGAGTFNASVENVHIEEYGYFQIIGGQHNRFNPDGSRDWTALRVRNCNDWSIIGQIGTGGFPGGGSGAGVETGLLVDGPVGATSPGSAMAINISSLRGPWLSLAVGIQNKSVTGSSANGVVAAVVANLAANRIVGNCINGILSTVDDPSGGIGFKGNLYPLTDDSGAVGLPSNRFNTAYFASAPVVSSDARLKTPGRPLTDQELAAFGSLQEVAFQFLSAVSEKGTDKARVHFGWMAQALAQSFRDHGLDPNRYALFCEDVLTETIEERDVEGYPWPVSRQIVGPNGKPLTRMGLRHDEIVAWLAAWTRQAITDLDRRVSTLERRST